MESRLEHSHLQLNSNIAKDTYAADLKGDFGEPTFVKWNGDTLNTPYKDGKTTGVLPVKRTMKNNKFVSVSR